MDFSKILNQVLSVAQESAKNAMNGNTITDKVAKIGGGAAAIGILSMIFGRNGGSSLAKLGSLAAIGSLAYQAYQKYQQNQTQAAPVSEENFAVTEQNAQASSQVILQAMIAAAASDGAISEQEKQAILGEAGQDPELHQWIEQAMYQPATVQQIAAQVGNNPALAAQVYLAARVVCADLARKEIVFLADLAEALGLDDALVEQLEQQAGF
ncbi:tellurite resistance TerB family protein [Actinobacillus pleuropneumoniae]|uniref:tellurite resistance TerB family protein n=1 Tax=Actinobacillus pleuropneumoniae TaxID=715 RepID=UPI003B97F783